MTAGLDAPPRSPGRLGPDRLGRLLWSEWTKLRTVRGWVTGLVLAGLLTVSVNLLGHRECGSQAGAEQVVGGPNCAVVLGPGGEAVHNDAYLVDRPLAAHGEVTARVTALTGAGTQPWSKAGSSSRRAPDQGRRTRR